MSASLSIGDVAAASGLRTSAIRYYEDVGILPKPDRVSGKRRYNSDTVDRLLMIRFCSRLGMRLTDVRGLLATPRGSRAKDYWRRLVDGKLDEIDGLITAAQGVKRILRESRDCDCVTLSSCAFLRDERAKPPPSRRRLNGLHRSDAPALAQAAGIARRPAVQALRARSQPARS
ncbi:MAG TPA: MerR family transcriptional regulator [Candidatus Dormibacteraeota bacterium]|nr:MerR family transcriptional regulator [Candidatus Dormibacteraeota bacterium]